MAMTIPLPKQNNKINRLQCSTAFVVILENNFVLESNQIHLKKCYLI